jgi:hypothetical protein
MGLGPAVSWCLDQHFCDHAGRAILKPSMSVPSPGRLVGRADVSGGLVGKCPGRDACERGGLSRLRRAVAARAQPLPAAARRHCGSAPGDVNPAAGSPARRPQRRMRQDDVRLARTSARQLINRRRRSRGQPCIHRRRRQQGAIPLATHVKRRVKGFELARNAVHQRRR